VRSISGILAAAAMALALFLTPVHAQSEAEGGGEGNVTGLPIPRFVSLSASRINMRVGPGMRYPIDWVYQRRGLPVEVVAEYELWRKVRDVDGAEGWMLKHMISAKRYALVTVAVATLRNAPEDGAAPVLYAKKGVQGLLEECQADWCLLQVDGTEGWLRKSSLWGAYSGEVFK
jgi:SH3-like domain-containing protein